jgi:hypothetical protein
MELKKKFVFFKEDLRFFSCKKIANEDNAEIDKNE